MTDEQVYGRLIIVGKEKGNDFTFVIDKTSVLLGRDPCCDIRIVNKEISRKHAEIYVDDDTSAVFILSMGREPVRVNGKPVTTAQELFTGDHIEVLLDGRSREFVFEGEDDTVEVAGARQPLGQLTNNNEIASTHRQLAACNSAAPPPAPPPPPPPPPKGKTFGTKAAAPPSPPPLPPIMKCKPEASLPLALQDAIKAGIKLRRVNKEEAGATPPKSNAAGFVPNPADLLKLKAGLRKTDAHNAMELTKQQERACDCSAEATKVQQDQAKTDAAEHEQHIIKQAAEGSEAVDDGMASLDEGPMLLASSSSAKGAQELTMPTTESEIEEEKQSEIQEPQKIELGQPMTAKKRVRWAEASTPEGAKDATMTIHLRKGELRQVINVDADNTVAFSQWALGSLEEDFEEHLPATITCKKARRDSLTTAPSSAGKTPMHSALRSLFGDEPLAVEFSPAPTCYVSDVAFNGAVAPAPTPATGAKAANPTGQSVIMNTMTLAAKLLELAQENVVTLELPTESLLVPRSALKEPCKVLLTPKSTGNSRKLPPSGTCEKSRLSQIGITEDAAKCTEVKQEISFNTVAAEETDGTPKLLSNTTWLLGGTPKSGSISNKENGHSARFSRSANRTPRVVIMERRTPTSHARCSNLKRATNSPDIAGSAINIMSQLSAGGLDAEEAAVKGEGHAHEKAACESNIQGERDGKISLKQYKKTVLKAKAYRAQAMQLQTQLRKMTMKVAKLTKAAKSVGQALEIERNRRFELQATVQQIVRNGTAAGELKHPIGEAQDGAIDISCHLSGVSGTVPQECLGVEPAICTSHPSSKVVVVRPAGHPCHDNDVGSRAERAGAVYVVRPRIEYSPAVVGVRMQQALSKKEATSTKKTPAISSRHVSSAASDMQSAKTTRSKVPATIFVKSLGKTTGHNESPLVVNDVELPQWLFPEAEKPENGIDVSAELEEAVRDAEAANLSSHDDQAHEAAAEMDLNAAALDTTATKNDQPPGDAVLAPESNFPIPDEESEEEEDALDEFCHVCGKSEEGDVLLLCDGCDNGCHLTCCNPPLKHIPKGDWFCKECFEKQQEITARSTRKSAKAAEPESIKKSAKLLEGAISKAEVPSLVKKVAEQSSKPGRGRRASVAPSTMDRGIIQEGPPRPTRSQRASVASGAAKPEVEELANASLKSSKGRRASMTTAAPQVNAKRTRGAAALNVIAEESCEENIDKKAMKGKKPRTADTKDKPAISEKTSTRTTRARATKEEDGAISVKRRRRSTQAESASVATRTTRSRR